MNPYKFINYYESDLENFATTEMFGCSNCCKVFYTDVEAEECCKNYVIGERKNESIFEKISFSN